MESVRRALLVLDKAGKAKAISDSEVKRVEKEILERAFANRMTLTLLLLHKCPVVDWFVPLMKRCRRDLKNPALLNAPRGKIYKNASHKGRLRKHCHAC